MPSTMAGAPALSSLRTGVTAAGPVLVTVYWYVMVASGATQLVGPVFSTARSNLMRFSMLVSRCLLPPASTMDQNSRGAV